MAARNRHCLMILGMISLFSSATTLEINGVEFATRLKDISKQGLGQSRIQELFNKRATFTTTVPTGDLGHDIVRKLAASVGNSFKGYSDAVKKVHHRLIEVTSNLTTTEGNLNVKECCKIKPGDNMEPWCFQHPFGSAGEIIYHKEILETMSEISKAIPNIGWQYYGNEEGLYFLYPASPASSCTVYDPRVRPWYVEASAPTPKDIVLAVESTGQMYASLIRNAVDILLNTTNPNDRITVVKFGRDVNSYLGLSDRSTCFSQDLALATPQNSRIFREFINSKDSDLQGPVKLLPVISKAFDYFKKAADTTERRKLLVIFVASDPVDVKDHSKFIREITAQNGALQREVVFQTYAFGSDISNDTKDILQKIAGNTSFATSTGRVQTGTFTHIQHGNQLRLQLHSYYSIFADSAKTTAPIVTVPYVDFIGLGLVISLCLPLHLGTKLQGVTCVDVELEDIFFNVTYYHQGIDAYAFIIDNRGRTILHPLLPKPTDRQEEPKFVNILSLEKDQGVHEVIESMKSGGNGSRRFHASKTRPRLGLIVGSQNLVSEYFWTKVPDTDYSLCMVFTNRDREVEMEPKLNEPQDEKTNSRVNYIHPYTLIHSENELLKTCKHDGQVATTDGSLVMFSGAAYTFLSGGVSSNNNTQRRSYDNFFKGSAYDQAPEFKESTRGWVALSGLVDTIWTDKPSTKYDLHILWRHLVTASGVIRIYPGTNYSQYDPSSFSWYKQAILSEGWIQVHPVEKQNTFNVMISQAILENSPVAIPVAVVGGEIRPTILYHILEDVYPACKAARCFIVDGNGYVLAHKLYSNKEVHPSHIMSMEPAIAHYLIDNGHLEEALCLDFLSQYRTLFNWKMAIKGWYVSAGSPRFELHAIYGTNVLVGITWDNDANSCNCKNVTQCMRNNQDICRCPCFETLKFNLCNNTLPDRGKNGPSACSILRNNFDVTQQQPMENSDISELEPCFTSLCDEIQLESNCPEQSGCQWCSLDGEKERSCHDRFYCGPEESPAEKSGMNVAVPIILSLLVLILILVLCCIIKYFPGLHEKLCAKKHLERDQQTATPSGRCSPIYYEADGSVKKVFGNNQHIGLDDSGRASMDSNDNNAISLVTIPNPEAETHSLGAIPPPPKRYPLQHKDSILSSDNTNLESQGQNELSNKPRYPSKIRSLQPRTPYLPGQGALAEGYDTPRLNESAEDSTENFYINKSADMTFSPHEYDSLSLRLSLYNDLGENQVNSASNDNSVEHNSPIVTSRDSGVLSGLSRQGSSQTYLKAP